MFATLLSLAVLLPAQDAPKSKLIPELRDVVSTAAPTTRFRVYAVLGERLTLYTFGAPRVGAWVGAVAFAFGGELVSSLNYYSLLLATSWVPWVLLLG